MSEQLWYELGVATFQTIYMVLGSGLLATLLGLPLGIFLFITRPGGILENAPVYQIANSVVNILRSAPFIILLVAIIPLTRWIVGTSIGTTAAIVPLSIAAIPFLGRVVETALIEIPAGLIEAGYVMGATRNQIIRYILLPEALPTIIQGLTLMLITLIGYSAMAGAIGGGGLGDLAIRYGYQRFDITTMSLTVIVLIIIVQLVQWTGDRCAKSFLHR